MGARRHRPARPARCRSVCRDGLVSGRQYAAAVGYALPPRVTRTAIIAGALPLTEPGAFDHLPTIDRMYIRMSRDAPWGARLCFRAMGLGAACAPRVYGSACRARSRNGGRRGAEGRRFHDVRAHVTRGTTATTGRRRRVPRHDAARGLRAEDIRVPVDIWAGTDDRLLDPSWPGELARRIPGAKLRMQSGGHFLAHLYYRTLRVAALFLNPRPARRRRCRHGCNPTPPNGHGRQAGRGRRPRPRSPRPRALIRSLIDRPRRQHSGVGQ